MQFSTVQRERLISPLNLALMAGLFAISFIYLKPSSSPGLSQGLEPNLAGAGSASGAADGFTAVSSNVDELGIAYLKARSYSGEVDASGVLAVVRTLAREGRHEEARALLNDYPDIVVTEHTRFEIDLEMSAVESPDSLYVLLEKLTRTPAWHSESLLERAVELSSTLEHPTLTYSLYTTWANVASDSINAPTDIHVSNIYKQCGDYLNSVNESHQAMTCYWSALETLPERFPTFDIKFGMMRTSVEGSEHQTALLEELINDDSLSVSKLTLLATTLLADGKPELAYPVFADVAGKDIENAAHWYSEAAKWAEASNQPAHAAAYLESMTVYQETLDEKESTQVRIENLLVGAGNAEEAVEKISMRIKQDPNNAVLLERGVVMSLQAGKPSSAFTWNSMLLNLEPDNTDAQERQSTLALAINDLPTALRWYRKLIKQDPSNIEVRTKLAQISEWNGQPQQAITHWGHVGSPSSLASQKAKVQALKEVVRLANMTIQPSEGAEALRRITMIERPSDADVVQLIKFYKLNGEPEKASEAVSKIVEKYGPTDFLLRTLAAHEFEHSELERSLAIWDQHIEAFGHTTDSSIARMEMLWSLNRKEEAAQAVLPLRGQSLLSQATDYQLRLMAEISWQYRYEWLSAMVEPRLETLKSEDQRIFYSRRTLMSLRDAGDNDKAIDESLKLWGNTGDSGFAIIAMQLALKTGNSEVLNKFSPSGAEASELTTKPEYWSQIAVQRSKQNDTEGAIEAYEQALAIDDQHVGSVGGLLWLAISLQQESLLQKNLKKYEALAADTPELWQPMAVGYLQLGAASTSVLWFYRLVDQIESDYSMLLTYADALEYAGRSSASLKVRQYALQNLRPILLESASDNQELLLRQYARISTRYESVGTNERLMNYLLADETQVSLNADSVSGDELWREDMAISWLMSTQQHELARVVIMDMQAKRLNAPAWQTLALALKEKDNDAIEAVMQENGTLSIGNHILALRQLGNDREAYVLAQKALEPGVQIYGSNASDRLLAQDQYVSLRNQNPSFIGAIFDGRSVSGLGVQDVGVMVRHTFSGSNLGLAFSLKNRLLDSDAYQLQGNEEIADLSATLFYENGMQSASLTAGVYNSELGDETYARGKFTMHSQDRRRSLTAELAMNESVELSSELLIAGAQNRATLAFNSDFGRRQFMRLRAELTEINTRFTQQNVATGVEGSAEVGIQGSFGSNQWTTSVRASQVTRDRVDVLPESLQLRDESSIDSVVVEEQQTVALNATLSRGGLGLDYPQVSSPRYYVSTNIGQTWPEGDVGVQIDAGAGMRILGGDELSFSVGHGALQSLRDADDATKLGINYRFHFQ